VNVFFCMFKKIIVVIENIFFDIFWSVGEPLRTCYVVDTTRKKTMFTVQKYRWYISKLECYWCKRHTSTNPKSKNWNATLLLKKKYTLEKSKIHYHQVKLFFHQVKLSFSSSQIVLFIKSSCLIHQVKLSFSSSQIVFFIKSNGLFHQVKLSFSSSQIVFLVFSSSQIVFFVFNFFNFLFRYA
jgi:hypothetical protein